MHAGAARRQRGRQRQAGTGSQAGKQRQKQAEAGRKKQAGRDRQVGRQRWVDRLRQTQAGRGQAGRYAGMKACRERQAGERPGRQSQTKAGTVKQRQADRGW
jgi:hypothetical protein